MLRSVQNDKELFFFTQYWLNLIKLAPMPPPGEGEFKDANLLKLSPKFDASLKRGNL